MDTVALDSFEVANMNELSEVQGSYLSDGVYRFNTWHTWDTPNIINPTYRPGLDRFAIVPATLAV
ncbi:hypothetical protein [Streptococcus sobrinus]|uniref:hypothetical protein n=1 Tax=Streptococcus sobrinus TaxID=1310 RepID=UPI0018AACE32|nr:hypothetical protein [Streptococcus sobrinus]